MARITWNDIGSREFSTGIDRGVFYDNEKRGYAWDGLISVSENNNTKIESIYYDGSKLKDLAILGEYEGSITAYQYPEEFEKCQGVMEDTRPGVLLTNQNMETFNLTYRTHYGNDVDGLSRYRVHIVYNLTAVPKDVEFNTISDEMEAIEFNWDITAVPERLSGIRPTAHIILDSGRILPGLLADIEDILYGYGDNDPTCPSLEALLGMLDTWARLIIIDNEDGTWRAIINNEDDYTDLGNDEFMIDTENVVYLDEHTYEVSSSDRFTEDI